MPKCRNFVLGHYLLVALDASTELFMWSENYFRFFQSYSLNIPQNILCRDLWESAMKIRSAVFFRVLAVGLLTAQALPSWATVYKAPLDDVMLLPQYCWSQYDAQFQGPQYGIHDCGPGMNHYCGGLLKIQKAEREISRGQRIRWLNSALTDIHYTLRWMQNYPNCPIRNDVLQMQNRVLMDLGMPPALNETPAPAPTPQIAPDTPDTPEAGTAPGNEAAPGGNNAQGSAQGASGSGSQLYPAPKIPPRDDSKIGMPGDPYCRFCPD
ncbi:hypothetical protein [Acidithiobacillus sp.]|uniref:hypothetical protein n=1 Tax=Acidithiobacillus sp. TaxID=1872118 RepID=UPI0031FE97A9